MAPGRYSATSATRSSNSVGWTFFSASRMPSDSNWNTPTASPRAIISYVFSSRPARDDVQRVLDHVEVAQAEEVHLQEADLLDRLHRVLRHRAVDLRAVLPHAGVRELERDDVGEIAVGDDDRGRVDRRVADDAL